MDTTIYFFTGTGNSLKVAMDIAKRLANCELIPIAKVWERENVKSTSINVGFIFPLYYSGLPKIVYDFIEKIDLTKSEYFFTVVTSAGDITELPLQQIEKLLKVKTKTKSLNAGFMINMPNNYIIGYDIHSEKRRKEFFKSEKTQVKKIVEIVKNIKNNVNQNILKKDLTRAERFNAKFREDVNKNDKNFYIDENCNNCGICELICPVNNIILVDGVPTWQHRCQQCLACINFCPERSIQFGKGTLKTQRYHHPDIRIQDISNQKIKNSL